MPNIFTKVWDALTGKSVAETILNPSNYRTGTPFGKDFWFWSPDGGEYYVTVGGDKNASLSAYNRCSPYSSIINQKAQAFINGNTWILNTQGKAKGKEAFTEIANKIRKLFTEPNPIQAGSHFEAQVYVNMLLFGFTVILANRPFGFPLYDAENLWAIPGNMIDVEETKELFYKEGATIIKSIVITYKGEKTALPLESLIIIKDFRPSFNSVILPEPRYKSIAQAIENIIGAMESRGKLIKQRGPRFLISSDQKDVVGYKNLTPDEQQDLQRQFAERYGLMNGQSQAIISGNNLLVTPVGFDVKELGLFEEVTDSSAMLCQELGFPKFLAGLSDPTFNNQETAEKALYERFIIPDSTNIFGQWQAAFKLYEFNLRIEKDYSHLNVLQTDKKSAAEARKIFNEACKMELEMDLMKVNRFLELAGEDPVPDGDVYFSEWKRVRGMTAEAGNNGQGQPEQQSGKLFYPVNGNGKADDLTKRLAKALLQ